MTTILDFTQEIGVTFIPPITTSHIAEDKPLIPLAGSTQLSRGIRSLPINTVWRWREEFLGVISGCFVNIRERMPWRMMTGWSLG